MAAKNKTNTPINHEQKDQTIKIETITIIQTIDQKTIPNNTHHTTHHRQTTHHQTPQTTQMKKDQTTTTKID